MIRSPKTPTRDGQLKRLRPYITASKCVLVRCLVRNCKPIITHLYSKIEHETSYQFLVCQSLVPRDRNISYFVYKCAYTMAVYRHRRRRQTKRAGRLN